MIKHMKKNDKQRICLMVLPLVMPFIITSAGVLAAPAYEYSPVMQTYESTSSKASKSREEALMPNVHLTISAFDENMERIYLSKDNAVTIKSEKGEPADFSIENGSIKASIPISAAHGEDITVVLDNSTHQVHYKDGAMVQTSSVKSELIIDGDSMIDGVKMENYKISIGSPQINTLTWMVSRDIEQTITCGDVTTNVSISSTRFSSTEDIDSISEMLTGDTGIEEFVQPCTYENASEWNDGRPYIEFEVSDDSTLMSIADGEVIGVDDVKGLIAVKYADGLSVVYEHVIPSVATGDMVDMEQPIGIIDGNLIIRTCDNGEWLPANWLLQNMRVSFTGDAETRFYWPTKGINMPRMYQSDSEWGQRTYGHNTIAGGGCGPSSMAMAVSALTGDIYTPPDIVDIIEQAKPGSGIWYYVKGEGSTYGIFPCVAEKVGLEIDDAIYTSEESLKSYLEDGKIVIISIGAGRIYKGSGHFIVLRGLDENGDFLINDSSSCFELDEGYSYRDILPIKSARAIYLEGDSPKKTGTKESTE